MNPHNDYDLFDREAQVPRKPANTAEAVIRYFSDLTLDKAEQLGTFNTAKVILEARGIYVPRRKATKTPKALTGGAI